MMLPAFPRDGDATVRAFAKTHYVFMLTVLPVLGAAIGCHQSKESVLEKREPIRPVLSIVAADNRGPSSGYGGKVEARYSTKLGFRLLGRIVTRQARLGDAVRKGQVLGTIDNIDLVVALESAEASLGIAKAESDNAAVTFTRQKSLLDKNATSQAEYDIAEQSMESAQSAVVGAQSVVDRARENLGYTSLKSDLDGVVTGVYAEVGETVAAGQVVFTIDDPSQREVVIDVAEEMLASIEVGSEFRVTVPPSEHQCTGKVREIAPQADVATRTRRLKISLENASEGFRLGSTVKVFPMFSIAETLSLPSTAILDRDGSTHVWIVDVPNKKVQLVEVKISDRNETNVVVSSGISAGDRVVIAGVHSLTDGQSIWIQAGAGL